MKQLFLVLFLFICACSGNETTVNLSDYKTYEARGPVKADLFHLNLSGAGIDEFHRLNPTLFPLANLMEASHNDVLIESTKTNKIYKVNFKKGDLIYLPIVDKD